MIFHRFSKKDPNSNSCVQSKSAKSQLQRLHELFPWSTEIKIALESQTNNETGSSGNSKDEAPFKNQASHTKWSSIQKNGQITCYIPYWKSIATTYEEAVAMALFCFRTTRNIPLSDHITQSQQITIQESHQKKQKFDSLRAQYGETVLPFDIQLGKIYQGKPPAQVCLGIHERELTLGVFEILIILLLFPETTLTSECELWIDAVGDECVSINKNTSCAMLSTFASSPCFWVQEQDGNTRICLGYRNINYADDRYGAATGFVLKD